MDCTKNIGYGFIQINGVIFIPNTEDKPYNRVALRSSDNVEGWETFDETAIEIPYVRRITVRRMTESGDVLYTEKIFE